ncbi:hypothetical protein LINGRAHAP2_LOCUS2044, partial [Linum grandiflorum]
MNYLYVEEPECVEVSPADERLLWGYRNRHRAGDVFTNEKSTLRIWIFTRKRFGKCKQPKNTR